LEEGEGGEGVAAMRERKGIRSVKSVENV